jgi:hypothetical protein
MIMVFLEQTALLAAQLPLVMGQLMRMVALVPIIQLLATLLVELQQVALPIQLAEQVVMEELAQMVVLEDLAQMVELEERQIQMALHLVAVEAGATKILMAETEQQVE